MCIAVKPADHGDDLEMASLYGVFYCTNNLPIRLIDNNIIRLVRIFAPYAAKKLLLLPEKEFFNRIGHKLPFTSFSLNDNSS